eukprot:8934678-Pyramimonas_sp.AAC.1
MNSVAFATTPVGLGAQLRMRRSVKASSATARPQLARRAGKVSWAVALRRRGHFRGPCPPCGLWALV